MAESLKEDEIVPTKYLALFCLITDVTANEIAESAGERIE